MRTNTTKRIPLTLVVVLAVVMVSLLGFSVFSGVSYAAEGTPVNTGETITVGHMSDIHYFPLEYCYTKDVDSDYYKSTDFYYAMTGDTKLVLESGITLNAAIQSILKDAKEHKAPQYFVTSGDLCKNGERVALIDVANTLRYLQNEMRKIDGYKNFQVFSVVGNHDLYNHNGELYSKETGEGRVADIVNSAQFALIFAGLGYPNATLDGSNGTVNLTDYLPAEYWSSSYTNGYQPSTNAENLNISYYSEELAAVATAETAEEKMACYYNIGDDINKLTYFAEIDDSDTARKGFSFVGLDSADRLRVVDGEGAPSRIGENEYYALADMGRAPILVVENNDGVIETDVPVSAKYAFSSGKNVYRLVDYSHITGGRISVPCLNWVESQTKTQKGNKTTLGEETIIATFHHNVLPHFEQEDDILKDFTLYNWEYTAQRMLSMGIRYALTGHMHASDVMTYTDVEGNTLYDFETGSTISYASPRRYLTFTRYNCDGKLGEQLESEVHILETLKETSDHVVTDAEWNQAAYNKAIKAFEAKGTPENWQAVLDSNPEFLTYIIRYDELSTMSYNEFISKDIYSILVNRMLDHFITDRMIDSLKGSVSNMLTSLGDSGFAKTLLDALGINDGKTLNGAVQYILDEALNNLYGESGYPFNGKTYKTALEYVRAIIDNFLDKTYGDENIVSSVNPTNKGKLNVREIASFIMMSHSLGAEISMDEKPADIDARFTEVACTSAYGYMQPTDKTYRKRMVAAMNDLDEQLKTGKFVQDLLDALLNPLFNDEDSLLKTLLGHSFDLRKTVDKEFLTQSQYNKLAVALNQYLNEPFVMVLIRNYAKENGIIIPEDFKLNINTEAFCLGTILNAVLPVAKPIVGDLLGFNMEGNDIIEIVENVLDSYVTPSFLVGLGGIADNIIVAFATDVYPDVANMNNPAEKYILQPHSAYTYGGVQMSYISTLNKVSEVGATFNAATQDNGRVPSRVTTNFDTKDSTTTYKIKFYTAENIYGTFNLKAEDGSNLISVSTSKKKADKNTDYFDSKASDTKNGIKVEMLTQTKPVYLPLIDLGLLCLTHAEVEYDIVIDGEKHEDVPFVYSDYDRDFAAKNSVVYWNVTTVTVSGLQAGTTYHYDIEGSYESETTNKKAQFSFAKFNNVDYFTLTTAADKNVTSFEFLTIADIQGMIQGMYDDSFKAVEALLADSRTKDFDFILNAGDMCDNGKNFNQWAMALNTYQKLFANTSMFFTAGNHENKSNAMLNFFNYTLPTDADGKPLQEATLAKNIDSAKNGVFYSFNYANAHFVVLNTNNADSNGLGETQLNWLKKDLEGSTAKWKFVLMHKSLFSGGSHSTDAEVVAMRAQLVPIFNQYGVDIVFAGHDHTYTSTYLLDGNGNMTEKVSKDGVLSHDGNGVLYITLGTMGTKFYNYKENENVTPKFDEDKSILHTLDSQTFGKVVVDGDTITFTGYYYNRETGELEVIDSSKETGNKPANGNILAIVLGVVIPVVVIAAVVVTLLVLKKKGVLGKKHEAVETVDEE
ncbi:MAG: metallophosphoesterase [Clostridia bacterium]|nr:metallophosphoesterase [Clostridia bacterium]